MGEMGGMREMGKMGEMGKKKLNESLAKQYCVAWYVCHGTSGRENREKLNSNL